MLQRLMPRDGRASTFNAKTQSASSKDAETMPACGCEVRVDEPEFPRDLRIEERQPEAGGRN